jgi:hypothetical protein
MNTWVQLKDGVAFACVQTPTFVENSILLGDEVSWEDVKAKKYENGSWVEAPLIYFVTHIKDNVVHQTNSTVFSSDVTGEVCTVETAYGWIRNEDGSFSPPPVPVEELIVPVEEQIIEDLTVETE